MAARFIRDAQIVAGFPPLDAMGRDAATPGSELRQQMRQLVAEGAIDLGGIMLSQARVQRDDLAARISASGRAEKSGIPFDADFARQLRAIESVQHFPRFRFESGITAQHHEGGPGGKVEIELFM